MQQNNQMEEYQYFIDNQNCLWLPNNTEEISEHVINQLSSIIENTEISKSLYLNHSVFMDKYENSDVIIPNDTEAFYYRITYKNCIKRIYIPASVEKITVGPSSDFYVDEHSVEFIVSEKNKNFVSVNGSIYTKDFKTLVYAAQKKGYPFLLDSRCEEIAKNCKVFVNKKLSFDIKTSNVLPNLKTINFRGIISKSAKLKIPEGVENLKSGFWFITSSCKKIILYIPSTVKKIGRIYAQKYKVNKKNKTYASYKNALYSADLKTFFSGNKKNLKIKNGCEQVFLSGAYCENIYLPKSIKNVFELNSTLENIRFFVNKENPYFAEYMGSLYTKDFETLLFLHLYKNGNSHDIHIHPNCKKYDEKAGIKKHKTRIGNVFAGNFFTTEEEIESFKKRMFSNTCFERCPVEISDFTMENFRNNIKEDEVFVGITIDKNTIFSDQFLLLNTKNDEKQISVPYFCQKENLEDAKDFFLADWNGILIDSKIVEIIDKLNKANYKTLFCCSGHILHSETVRSKEKTLGYVLIRKPYGTVCRGYIKFKDIPQKIKKIFNKLPDISYDKLCENIQESYTEPLFFYRLLDSTLEFYYKNTIQEQDKALEMLKNYIF